ncbi:hypothetical protein G5714_004815 [Onychostoma macrolepis]|uniref:Uncharacterized protein n=1 Tax=Onychostoma macrolepis TaxID=369639 RepID=A0A7J6D5V9_9TELE|nr:hypothetical protein G5714_004815 [Onychostoma macrolepis]
MNSMFLVWTLSFLILSYTLGFPMFNGTSVSHMETFPNVTESNSTDYIKTNLTNSSLILSYTLGFPILNGTSSGSHMETLINVTMGNITEFNETSQIRPNFVPIGGKSQGCRFIPTCAMHNLADHLQTGDEKAGKSASDSWGPGKK